MKYSQRWFPVCFMVFALILAACGGAPEAPAASEPTAAPASTAALVPTNAPAAAVAATSAPIPTALAEATTTTEGSPDVPGGSLVIASADDPEGLDPQTTYTFGWGLGKNLYSFLVTHEIDPTTGSYIYEKPIPDLAESWEISEDKTRVTFKIREGVTFSNGDPVTAEDIRWSLERTYSAPGFGKSNLAATGITELSQITATGPYELEIVYPDGMTRFSLVGLAVPQMAVYNKNEILKHATTDDPWALEWVKRNVVGSGPYVVESWKPGEELILKAREDYYGNPKPSVDRIVFRIIPDEQTRYTLLQSGEIDGVLQMSPQRLTDMQTNPDLKIISVPAAQDTLVLRFNPAEPPFDDIKFRQAVIKAIPYDTILNATVYGYGTPVQGPCGASTFGYKDYDLYEYDMEEAKQLLSESAYAEGASFSITLPTRDQERIDAAIWIQNSLAELGVTMEIQQVPYAAYADRAGNREFNTNMHTMGPWYNDCLYWAYWMFRSDSPTNYISYTNPVVDELVIESFSVTDEQEYLDLVTRVIDEQLVADAVMAPLYQPNWTVVVKQNVDGIYYWPWLGVEWKYVTAN